MGPTVQYPFDSRAAHIINKARLEHLASLGLNLHDRRVLEVGAGVGLLTHFFEERQCAILSTEGRKELCEENIRRHPHRRNTVKQADLMEPGAHLRFGEFEVVFCYGTLYHVEDPLQVLQELSTVCTDLFLLETVVYRTDNGQINPVGEGGWDQSIHNMGCRPSRNWVWETLNGLFEYVYHTRKQPYHFEFVTSWPNQAVLPRSVFIASRNSLSLDTLSDQLLERQEHLND
jgi:SAM-dependent methyltransferase